MNSSSETNNLKAVIVGSGTVGYATGTGLVSRGKQVSFIDTNPAVIQRIRANSLEAFTPSKLRYSECECDLIFLSVPTPTDNGKISLNYLKAAAGDIGDHLRSNLDYHVVIVRSTVPPGTSENIIAPIIESISGKKLGKDFGLCMNPEYLREKTAVEDFAHPWVIVIGEFDAKSGEKLAQVYQGIDAPLYRISIREAEMQKYVHNLFNATKISFFNEFRELCQAFGLDAETIFQISTVSTEGIWNPNYGIKDNGPFGGMCLPKDTQAFYDWAKERGWDLQLLNSTIQVNENLKRKQSNGNGNGKVNHQYVRQVQDGQRTY